MRDGAQDNNMQRKEAETMRKLHGANVSLNSSAVVVIFCLETKVLFVKF